jgi:hypothetical protein
MLKMIEKHCHELLFGGYVYLSWNNEIYGTSFLSQQEWRKMIGSEDDLQLTIQRSVAQCTCAGSGLGHVNVFFSICTNYVSCRKRFLWV